MKILVTGCAGFIGSHLCDRLLKDGHEVHGIDNFIGGQNWTPEGVKLASFGLELKSYLQGFFEFNGTFDLVYHLAALGSVPRSIEEPALFMQNNVGSFENLLDVCRRTEVPRVVFASSSSVYGDNQDEFKYESVTGQPLSPYAMSKQINEMQAAMYQRLFGVNYIGLRFFNVFGPRQRNEGAYAPVIAKWIKQLQSGQVPQIYGNTARDYTYVDNVVDALVLAGVYGRPLAWNKIYNIGCGKSVELEELHYELAGHFDERRPGQTFAPRPGDIPKSCANITKARRELGYEPTVTWQEGVARLCKELK